MAWTNADGLVVRFGNERAEVMPNGWTQEGIHKTLVHKITDATALGDTDTAAVNPHEAFIPAGAVITRATFNVKTAFAGATAVLDLGLKQADGTNIDDDGIDAAVAVTALDAAGDTIVCDGAYIADGDLTGVRLATDAYIMATYDTAAFTAGVGTLVVEYIDVDG